MRLVINARFLTQEITGVQRFAIELCKRLIGYKDLEIEFLSPKGVLHKDLEKEFNSKEIGTLKGHLWEQIDLPKYLRKNGNPLLLNLCSTAPIRYKNQIVTHHDITYIRFSNSFSKQFVWFYKTMAPLFLKNSKKIITVSEFSRQDISNYYQIPASKFEVIPNGVNPEVFKFKESPNTNKEKYILAVSSRNYHKNFQVLINAFRQIKESLDSVNLYIVGESQIKSFSNLDIHVDDLISEKRIQFLGRIDDDELVKMYQNASLFVFPSLYEGFGIPPIEAQSCGCPVIASNVASMPEVLKDSVMYFNPTSAEELGDKMVHFFENNKLQEELKNKGKENAALYNWDFSAKRLLDLIKTNM